MIAILILGGLGFVVWRVAPSLRIATGSVSKAVCAGVFVSGLDSAQIYREEQLPNPALSKLNWALRYTVDREHKEVRATVLGGFESRSVYQEGYGCHLVREDGSARTDWAAPPPASPAAEGEVSPFVEAIDPRLSPALDAAFAEVDARALRQTKPLFLW